jgi:MFS family permease
MNQDEEHLKLLAIFHYVVGGMGTLFACFPLLYVGMGVLFVASPHFMTEGQKGPPPPAAIGYVLVAFGAFFALLGWSAAIATILSGRYIARRRKRMFSVVMGAILCMFMPFGTVLGVFTIIVLTKESVQRLYGIAPDKTLGGGTPAAGAPVAPPSGAVDR